MNPLLFSQTNREKFDAMCTREGKTNITSYQVLYSLNLTL